MDPGIQAASRVPVVNPLPPSWIGIATAPPIPPSWASIQVLTSAEISYLQAQIAYDLSNWDYAKVGSNNELGRYQFTTTLLETYGLLAPGSNTAYGIDCVNYRHCWRPTYINNNVNAYQNYFYNSTTRTDFITNRTAQEHLAYQHIVDLYILGTEIGTILSTDSPDSVAGMIYVSWTLGTGSVPSPGNPNGTGAWSWRYRNIGNGTNSYNSGRYAVLSLGL